MKTYVTANLSRYCVNCEEKESDHPGGQCLFSSQKFEPHRLSGDSSQCLWAPVTVDVMIDDTAYELDETLRQMNAAAVVNRKFSEWLSAHFNVDASESVIRMPLPTRVQEPEDS